MTTMFIINIYNEAGELVENKPFILQEHIKFELTETNFGDAVSLVNYDISKIPDSQLKEIHNVLKSIDYTIGKLDVIIKIDGLEISKTSGINEATYFINDSMLKDDLGKGILLECLKFMIISKNQEV
jgi:hypothetical protein